MSFLILCASLALAGTPTSTTPILTWQKPVNLNLDPGQATVIVLVSRTHVDEGVLANMSNWQPDGWLVLDGETATKSNILAALNQAKQYGHVILDVDMLGVGGDFGDPFVMPYGAVPDDVNGVLRPSEIMKAVQGNQAWVAVISNTMNDDVTSGNKEAFIGPDASQWMESATTGSSVFVLTSSNVQNLPSAVCQENFGAMLFGQLTKNYATGQDLSFYDLNEAAKATAEVTLVQPTGSSSCHFVPEVKYQGNVIPKTVMFQGSGVLPDPVVELKPEFRPVVDPVVPLINVPMTATVEPRKPKHIDSAIFFGVGGACAVGSAVFGAIYANEVKENAVTFSDENVRDNFVNVEAADKAAIQAELEMTLSRNSAIGAGIGAGLFLAGGTITWLF